MHKTVNTVKLAITIISGLLWFTIAIKNINLIWQKYIKKEERVPSLIPIIGGFFAYVCAMGLPFDNFIIKFSIFIIMVLLDFGCYISLFILIGFLKLLEK